MAGNIMDLGAIWPLLREFLADIFPAGLMAAAVAGRHDTLKAVDPQAVPGPLLVGGTRASQLSVNAVKKSSSYQSWGQPWQPSIWAS